MAAPGAGGRRASTSRVRRAAVESNENDDLAAAPSSSSAFAHPAASVPHFSLPPRSPLAAIADPGRNPRSAPVTPKSLAGTPRACAAGTGARDRTSSAGAARRVFDLRDLAAPDVPLEVPHFELDEDPAFWKDRNVQAKVNEDASGDIMALQRQIEELKDQLTCLKKQQNCPGSPGLQLLDSDFASEFKTLCGVDDQPDCDLNILKQKVSHLEDVLVGSLRREKSAETKIGKLEAEIQHLNRLINLMESDAQRLRRRLELRGEKQRLHPLDENAALSQEIRLLQEQIHENPQLTHFALENKRLIEELTMEVNKLRCELIQYQKPCTNQDQAGRTDVNKQFIHTGTMANISESFQFESPYEIDSEDLESPSHLYDPETRDFRDPTTEPEYDGALFRCFNLAMGSSHDVLDKKTILKEVNFLEKDGKQHVHEKVPVTSMHLHDETLLCQEIEIVNSRKHRSQDELEQLKRTNQELKEKLVIMAEESNRLSEIIVAKDVEIASLSEEWEAAIFDLTSFLTDGCRSLDDAYQNIDNMISSFPHSNSSVSEQVEKAMKVSIEKEKMIFKLQIELQAAQKIGREVKEKLHILRGATLAITEAQQLDNEENSQEELQVVGLLHQKDCIIQELKDNLKEEKCLFAETASEHSCHNLILPDSSDDMIEEQPHDENPPTISQANPDYQSKLDSMIHLVEDKSNKVLTLFSNFEAAQETMEEAELMISTLLKASEELKLERDNSRQAVEVLLSEKTSLIGELKLLETSSSQRYDKLHQQTNDCVVEMAKLAAIIRGSFQQMQRVSTAELFALCSEIITFGQDLKRCISESRSYIVNMVSLIEEKGKSTKQIQHLNANAYGSAGQQVESHCQSGSSKPDFSQSDYSTDYASLRREFDRKSNIAEGLSFDLRLLQESTSNAKDMKDKANAISTALSNVQRELDIKTNAMENMLKKQKALEEELAQNDTELTILRSELEQSQSLSSALFKENKDLREMLDEETVKNSEMEVLLEDKENVIEGLESQILLLNRSEVGRLMSDIEELNNSIKIMSSDRENLQAEIHTLREKLEMAMALSEENEAAAIEARQTAEVSKIYAEEKEEEVKILERSVEELEGTVTVLEEEVSNLKEEVRSYQLHKQSEDQLQAVDDTLAVEKTSKCDATEELCQGKCRLKRRLQAEILAHQDVRKKIEGLAMEVKHKDDEIRQYKEHIAELVLHSEAQSLLFQEKFHELEHMVSGQKFGPHESSSETVHAKIEKPSGRARGSGSPFRCISSIIQQMNSEKDQEISVSRQRIEELEGLVSGKQKEICLLTSRLAAVDTMTHDIIRELLGVKLDMTNYANLLDQEELQKVLIASQQQIEQSKAKDIELEVLKEELGHLILERDSLLDDMDQRKTDLLETQLLVEQLEQREQMLETQIEILQLEKDSLQQKIMEMDETMELLVRSNQPETNLRMGDNQHHGSSEFSRRLAQSDMLLSHTRHEHVRSHANRSSRTHHGRHR
ncbi:unnamed protein product [Urochloa decumbens]|uniref:Uncharacterized protein n=1 Tax=Urochloa decumbens TaxID=240449 RepID=A0ABC9G2K4_9POAL